MVIGGGHGMALIGAPETLRWAPNIAGSALFTSSVSATGGGGQGTATTTLLTSSVTVV